MLNDRTFLTGLPQSNCDAWSWELSGQLGHLDHEIAGALWILDGRPFSLTWAELTELRKSEVSPGGLIGQGCWSGADAALFFHTRVTTRRADVQEVDLAYAGRLREMVKLFGALRWHDHVLITKDEPVSLTSQLPQPDSVSKMKKGRAGAASRCQRSYRQPVTGEVWAGRGCEPVWLRNALAEGFSLGDFEVGAKQSTLTTVGVPSGARLFRSISLDLRPRPPAQGMNEIRFHTALEGPPTIARLAQGLHLTPLSTEEPCTGVLYLGDTGLVTAPRAGWTIPTALAQSRPALLFERAVRERAACAVTFSTVPPGILFRPSDLEDYLGRLVHVGRLLGISVLDHLVLASGERWLSVRKDKRGVLTWPRIAPIDSPFWPPSHRAHQRAWVIQHPEDGRVWTGRGTKPEWVRALIESGGWNLEALRVLR